MRLKILTNKKAFYFTIVVLFCVVLLLLLSYQYKRSLSSEGIRTRISTADNFIKSLERDGSRALYVSGYRTMLAINAYLTSTHNVSEPPAPISNPAEVFADALFNSSLESSLGYSEAEDYLQNTTIRDWENNVHILADRVGLIASFDDVNSSNFYVIQTDPWHISLILGFKYNISDPVSGVMWHRNANITSLIPIYNFEDPLYDFEFGPRCGNKIIHNNYSELAVDKGGGSCNIENLTRFFETNSAGSMYIASPRAPSFLMRLAGVYAKDPEGNGIESMINPDKVSACMGISSSLSIVDFQYVNEVEKDTEVIDMSWVKLLRADALNESLYNMSSICLL